MSDEKQWSDRTILKSIKNPNDCTYKIALETEELTILGVPKQPDFGKILITYVPGELVIELRSLKEYIWQFREKVISYERLINVIFEDLKTIYNPIHLNIKINFNPRGGISSKLEVDSSNRVCFERKAPEEIPPPEGSSGRCSDR